MTDRSDDALEDLVRRLRVALGEAGVPGHIAWDRESRRLLSESWPEPFYVDECWADWPRVPEDERETWLRKFVAVFLAGRQVPATWEEARRVLLPRIRPRITHAIWPLRRALEGMKIPALPCATFTPHLMIEFAWAQEQSIASVSKEDVAAWGVELDDVREAGFANLVRETPTPVTWRGSPEFPGVWRSPWRDRFDPSRVLLGPDVFPVLDGPPVVLAISERYLLVAGGNDVDGLFQLGRIARRELEVKRRFLWLRPLRLQGEEWVSWMPEPSHGAFSALKFLHAVNVQADYRQHGEFLQRLLDREGKAMKVAPVLTLQDMMGNALTAAVWEEGGPQLLPVTDAVVFRQGGENRMMVPFPRVVEVLGDLLEGPQDYPPRVLARMYPEDWQLQSLAPPGS